MSKAAEIKNMKDERPVNIILLGDPAAGKATQSAFLVKKFKLYDFDMGKELNILRNKNREIDATLKHNTDKGKLTPTSIVRDILRKTISSVSKNQGILFDGHPKMLGEAKLVKKLLKDAGRRDPVVIYLSIPMDEMLRRIQTRKGYFSGKFGKRGDDSSAALKNRSKYYRVNIAQVIEYFQKNYKFKKISGLGSVSQVRTRIKDTLSELGLEK